MPNHKIHWVNDHTEICDRLDARVQLMQTYLDTKPEDFDGIAVKQFLLSQAREQVAWYRQSIDALDFVGCVDFRDTEQGTEYRRDPAFPILPELWTRHDETRFEDAGETPDAGLFDLRGAE